MTISEEALEGLRNRLLFAGNELTHSEEPSTSVTGYVVQSHTRGMGWFDMAGRYFQDAAEAFDELDEVSGWAWARAKSDKPPRVIKRTVTIVEETVERPTPSGPVQP